MPRPRQSLEKKIFYSPIFLVLLVILLSLITISISKTIGKNLEIKREVDKLQEEAERLEQENQELSELTNYFETESYKEKEARQRLNLQKPGEKVVFIQYPEEGDYNEENNSQDKSSFSEITENPSRWWSYFFSK